MNLDIRIATRDDLPILIRLYAEMDNKPPLSEAKAAEIFADMASIQNYHIYITYYNTKPIGTFSLLFVPTMMHPSLDKFAVLEAVTVSPAYRGQGIGKAMIQEALKISAAAGCYKVTLSSNLKREKAHTFYQSLGFKQHGWSFSREILPEI